MKAPWHHIGIDSISPQADDGSKFIFTVCDYFTKSVEAVGVADKSAQTVAKHLFMVTKNIIYIGIAL